MEIGVRRGLSRSPIRPPLTSGFLRYPKPHPDTCQGKTRQSFSPQLASLSTTPRPAAADRLLPPPPLLPRRRRRGAYRWWEADERQGYPRCRRSANRFASQWPTSSHVARHSLRRLLDSPPAQASQPTNRLIVSLQCQHLWTAPALHVPSGPPQTHFVLPSIPSPHQYNQAVPNLMCAVLQLFPAW